MSTKVTITAPTEINGKTYPAGTTVKVTGEVPQEHAFQSAAKTAEGSSKEKQIGARPS